MVSGVAVGKADDEIVLDLGKDEDNYGQSDMPIAFAQRTKNILLLQMDGLLTREEIAKALEKAEKGANTVYGMQADALRKNYEGVKENVKVTL
jgi:exosome complex component RRP41